MIKKILNSKAFILFWLVFIQTIVVVYDIRAIAAHSYVQVFLTDIIYGVITFTVLKKIIEAESKWEVIAFTLGGAFGGQAALYLFSIIGA